MILSKKTLQELTHVGRIMILQ